MPDQNSDPTTSPFVTPSAGTPFPPIEPVTPLAEAPPLPPVEGSDLPPAPPIIEQPGEAPPGSAAPAFDITTTGGGGEPKKKFGGKKVIATILGLLVLVGGLGAGVILVRQQQDIRQRASGTEPCRTCSNKKCLFTGEKGTCNANLDKCKADSDCTAPTPTATRVPTPTASTPTPTQTPSPTSTPRSNLCPKDCVTPKSKCVPGSFYPDESHSLAYGDCGGIGSNEYCCDLASGTGTPTPTPTPTSGGSQCSPGYTFGALSVDAATQACIGKCDPNKNYSRDDCKPYGEVKAEVGGAFCYKCLGGTGGTGTPTPTVTNAPGGGVTAQCFNVRAFDTSWDELSTSDLAKLKAGDKVRFTIGGNASSGSFDKAKFKVNGVERSEVTGKKPSSQDFFDEYTIPTGVTTFTINAQIHHSTLGWSK